MLLYVVVLPYFCAEIMIRTAYIGLFIVFSLGMKAQEAKTKNPVVNDGIPPIEVTGMQDDFPEDGDLLPLDFKEMPSVINLTFYRYRYPTVVDGDTMYTYLMPELPVYKEKIFRNERERRKYNRLILNVKKVLPLAKLARMMLQETYEVLETLPTKKEKEEHIKQVERDIKKQYTPVMKKLTFTQGKILIKLIDRECNQEAYDIVKAFLGPMRAAFYQVFAWTFKASLKKHYDPEGEDAEIERIVRQIEVGQL